MLAGVWSQILALDGIGTNDNFFDLGGHSLLATQLVSRIRESFGIEVSLRSIFEKPTIRELGQEVELALQASNGAQAPPIKPVSRDADQRLSFAQERLWFLNQLEPNSPFYNCPMAVRLNGELDVAALEDTLSEVVRRHEALRTSFNAVQGEPLQRIAEPFRQDLAVIDLSRLTEAAREITASTLSDQEAQRVFDLTQAPLVRMRLLRLGPQEHAAIMTSHHIISDGWSMGVLIREVGVLYEAYRRGLESPMKELPIQYVDYAVWQREWLRGEVLQEEIEYWRAQLAGATAVIDLPTDRPRPAVQRYTGASKGLALSEELTEALRQLSKKEGVTLFMTLLAAFQVLLSRYSDQEDISIGTPIAGRSRTDLEGLIGFFVNTLVLRNRVEGEALFLDLLHDVRETTLGAYAHQELPFEKLVEEMRPERDPSYTPLFQVMFALQNAPHAPLELAGLTLSPFAPETTAPKFDLTLVLREAGGRIAGAIEYDADLFDAGTIEKMITHFERLLASIASQPHALLKDLKMLSDEDDKLLLRQVTIEELEKSFSF
jgi:acyl carrier protein